MPVTPSTASAFGAYPATPPGSSPSDYESCPGSCEDAESKPTPRENCVTPRMVSLVHVDKTSTTDITKISTFRSLASHNEDTSPDTSRRVTTQDPMTLILNILKLAAGRRQLTPAASTNLSHLLKKLSSDLVDATLPPPRRNTIFPNNPRHLKLDTNNPASDPDTNNPANDPQLTAK